MSLRSSSYNMAAPLSTRTVEDKRSVIRLFWWSPLNKKVRDAGFSRESHADRLLGCQWPYIGALPGKGSNCDQCWIQWHDSDRVETRHTIETPLSERVLLLHDGAATPPIQRTHYVVWNLRWWNINRTVRTWRGRTFTCLDLRKNVCGAGSLQMATR